MHLRRAPMPSVSFTSRRHNRDGAHALGPPTTAGTEVALTVRLVVIIARSVPTSVDGGVSSCCAGVVDGLLMCGWMMRCCDLRCECACYSV